MKIIDLLNKIANGEEVPEKILYKYKHGEYYKEIYLIYDKHYECYYDEEGRPIPSLLADNLWNLNDEVEIIEEEPYVEICGRWFTKSEYDEFVKGEKEKKIPEKLIPTSLKGIDNLDEKIDVAHIDTMSAIETINEIIDYLKSKGE